MTDGSQRISEGEQQSTCDVFNLDLDDLKIFEGFCDKTFKVTLLLNEKNGVEETAKLFVACTSSIYPHDSVTSSDVPFNLSRYN